MSDRSLDYDDDDDDEDDEEACFYAQPARPLTYLFVDLRVWLWTLPED